MKIEKIKPIPKYILARIRKEERKYKKTRAGYTRFYSYFSKNDGELVLITVACRNSPKGPRWRCKQVIVHGIHSKECFLKDIVLHFMGNYSVGWYDQGLQKARKWFEHPDWGWQDDKYFNIYCKVLNKEYILKKPEFRYSALDEYPYCDTMKYLRIYEKFPQAEMLVKFGLAAFATSVQILRKIGKDKRFRTWLIEKRNEIRGGGYYVSTLLTAYATNKPLKEIQDLEQRRKEFYRSEVYRDIKAVISSNKEIDVFLGYIKKQRTSYYSYKDYLRACEYLGLDMSLPKNRYPHDFKRWHDIRIDQYRSARALKEAEERKELFDKFAAISDKYLSLQRNTKGAFIVVIARSPQELTHEGDTLHHCVGHMGYDQKFIREESLIFFVRNAAEPDTPFVTMEYSLKSKKILQCYGARNNKPNDNVMEFVNNKWLPFANRQLKKIQIAA